jgi:hypothetical protein
MDQTMEEEKIVMAIWITNICIYLVVQHAQVEMNTALDQRWFWYWNRDPYKNFIYTSFQELATYVSHNAAQMARNTEITNYLKCVKWIGDEMPSSA